MIERNNGACRLCLIEIYQKCDFINNTQKDMVQIILPDVNLEISENLVLCKTCSNSVEEAFIFKSTCLEIEDSIHNYANDEVQADLEKLIGLKDIDGGQRQKICRTCLDVIDNDQVYELGCEKDNLLVNMLQKCLPEVDLHLTKHPVLCENCKSQLKKSYSFVCQCMDNEEKISDFQRNNQGKTLDLIEAVRVISSKNEYKIPEINISNVLTSPDDSSKNENSEHEKTERVVGSVQNENIIILSLVSIPQNQPENHGSPGVNIPNVLKSPRDIPKSESIVTEKVLSSVQNENVNISPLMSLPRTQPDNDIISRKDNIDSSETIDLSELELVSSVPAQPENNVSNINNMDCHQKNDSIVVEPSLNLPTQLESHVSGAINMDVDQQNESTELQLVSSKANGEEIFVISDDDDVTDNSANDNRQLMYNIRKRSRKKVSDEYAFREDLDDPVEDPDFNPEVDDSSEDFSDVEYRKIEHKNKKRVPKSNMEVDYLYCRFCHFRHVNELCLDEHIAICKAAENYRQTKHLRQRKSLPRRKDHMKNSRSKSKPNEAALWKRLEMIQQTLKNLEELKNMEKHEKEKKKKKKKKKKAKRDFKKSEGTDVSMQVQFTLKNAPIASHQTIQVAVDNDVTQETENNPLVTENSILTQKSSISSHSDAIIILPETVLENSGKVNPLPETNRLRKASKDQNQNNIGSDDLFIIEETASINSSEAEKVPIIKRTSMLSHRELNVLKCALCEFNTRFYNKMEQHVASHFYRSATNCYICIDTCKLNFEIAEDLINHLKNRHYRVIFKIYYWCVNCSSVFLAYSLLREHLHECPQKNKTMVKLFRSNTMIFCMVCDFETRYLDEAKLHRKTCHFKELTVLGDTIEID